MRLTKQNKKIKKIYKGRQIKFKNCRKLLHNSR